MNIEELPKLPDGYLWLIENPRGEKWQVKIGRWNSVMFAAWEHSSLEEAVKECWRCFQWMQKEHGA